MASRGRPDFKKRKCSRKLASASAYVMPVHLMDRQFQMQNLMNKIPTSRCAVLAPITNDYGNWVTIFGKRKQTLSFCLRKGRI